MSHLTTCCGIMFYTKGLIVCCHKSMIEMHMYEDVVKTKIRYPDNWIKSIILVRGVSSLTFLS